MIMLQAVNAQTVLEASGLAILLGAFVKMTSPFRACQRAMVHTRAMGYLLREMCAGAWERRSRWSECVRRAKWEV